MGKRRNNSRSGREVACGGDGVGHNIRMRMYRCWRSSSTRSRWTGGAGVDGA